MSEIDDVSLIPILPDVFYSGLTLKVSHYRAPTQAFLNQVQTIVTSNAQRGFAQGYAKLIFSFVTEEFVSGYLPFWGMVD
jgi:hypothetical protein